jgi:regulator of protease activity HflC (stomatin/prohibitin superfamily)
MNQNQNRNRNQDRNEEGDIECACNTKPLCWLGSSFCCIGVLLVVILIPLSIKDVNHEEYALRYEGLTKELDTTHVYEEGKYIFEPQTELFKYNKIVGTVAFRGDSLLECLSKDGIIIYANVVFQYQLRKSELFDIFWEFGEESSLKELFVSVAKDSVRNVIARYEAIQFYGERSTIESAIGNQLSQDFIESGTHADITFLQLENYDFPDELSNAIFDKQRGEQDLDTANNEREGALTGAETALLLAEVEAEQRNIQAVAEGQKVILEAEASVEVISSKATAEATVILIAGEAEATSTQEVWEKRKVLFYTIKDTMGMTNDEFVNDYLYSMVLNNAKNPITKI